MSVDWSGYEPYDPCVSDGLRVLPREEARRVFRRCMETKSTRIEMLGRLVAGDGVELGAGEGAVQDLNDWFLANVEADPGRPGRLLPIWYSVCHDVALFLGDVMIEQNPNLRWEFFVWGKTNVAFQRHVIMGFSTEDPKFHTNIDIDDMVAAYAHRVVESRGSIPRYGIVEVRGVKVDVDVVAARHRSDEVDSEMFRRWLRRAGERA